MGRWTSSDPGDFVDGLNMYVYVRNNPVMLVDEDGYEGVEPPPDDVVDGEEKVNTKSTQHEGKIRIEGDDESLFDWVPGKEYKGDDEFIKEAVASLELLISKPTEAKTDELILSFIDGKLKDKLINIVRGDENRHNSGTIYFNPTKGLYLPDDNGFMPPFLGLHHEFAHAYFYYAMREKQLDWQSKDGIQYGDHAGHDIIMNRYEHPAADAFGYTMRSEYSQAVYDNIYEALYNANAPRELREGRIGIQISYKTISSTSAIPEDKELIKKVDAAIELYRKGSIDKMIQKRLLINTKTNEILYKR